MLHPSYNELMAKINDSNDKDQEPIINSRYSIVIASAKRARQLISGAESELDTADMSKPLSTAVGELFEGIVHIVGEEDIAEDQITDL